MSIPNGWYAVCLSHEIGKNQIKPLSILNNEFIVFRSSTGKPRVLSAYCPHEGTHIGYGGKVANNCVVCPFHCWHFDEEGKCVKIPYCNKIPHLENNSLTSYPTIENEGVVLMYYHKEHHEPDYFLPNFSEEFPDDLWTTPKRTIFYIKTHVHELGENGFDIPHFLPVHGSERNEITVESPVTEKVMRYKLRLYYPGSGMGVLFSKINALVDWSYHGVTVFSNIVTLDRFPTVIRQNYYFTPQNNGEIAIRFALRIKKSSLQGNALAKWLQIKLIHYHNIKLVLRNFNEDRPIWENKIYRPSPVLCEGDGPIVHYRRWAQQFYSIKGPFDH